MYRNDDPSAEMEKTPNFLAAISERLSAAARSRITLAMFFGLSAVAVVAEPFGTYGALSLLPRVFFWSVVVGVSIVAGAVCDELSLRIVRPFVAWRAVGLATVMMTLVFAPFVLLWTKLFQMFGVPLEAPIPDLFVSVLVPSMTVYAVIHTLRPHMRTKEESVAEPEKLPAVPIIQPRLATRLDHPEAMIFRVSANDHMTELATDRGLEQIRMRFADAVMEMEPVAGCHVHRSHWVALEAVDAVERQQGKLIVRLTNGDELPVSRTYRPALEAARPDLF